MNFWCLGLVFWSGCLRLRQKLVSGRLIFGLLVYGVDCGLWFGF